MNFAVRISIHENLPIHKWPTSAFTIITMCFLAAKKFEWQNGAAKEEHSNVAQVVEQRLLQGE